jgi:hypothetical protein
MNLLAGQNSAAVELQQSQSPARLGQAPGQAACLPDGAGQQVVNQFVRLLDGIEVRSRQLDFSCSSRLEKHLSQRAESLRAKLEASLSGIVTRVDVDKLSLLELCVNALIAEGAESSALQYAIYAEDWCSQADFTDKVAAGNAHTTTAEMYSRLRRYDAAARHFRIATTALQSVLDFEHPLAAHSRNRHKMVLTELAYSDRKNGASAFGAGFLKPAETQNLCPLVWDGPTFSC